MAVKPKIVTMTNSSVDVLNAIRNSATINYRNYVPVATADPEVIRAIGQTIMDNPMLQNEFLTALVNRIGRVLLSSKLYTNPWAIFKKGMLEFGEVIEDVFVELAKPYDYDPSVAESQVFKREIPDVRSTFYVLNYQKFYKATIQQNDLRKAFLSMDGVTNLIAKIVEAMYTSANYDEFLTMKYLIYRRLTQGLVYVEDASGANTYHEWAALFKGVSNELEFMNTKYNLAGVHTHTLKSDQHIIINSKFDATMDVTVLATAFNMDKAEFMGRRHLVDSFGSMDIDRLDELFKDDPNYVQPSSAELTALDAIPALIVDDDFFVIVDNLIEFTEQYNGEGLYWNYWYHTWKTFAVSPFANAIAFVPATPAITSVTVTPSTATAGAGDVLRLSVAVVATNYAPQSVEWSSSDETVATVDKNGVVTISADAQASDTATITATSTFDGTKSDACVITVA